MDTDTAKTPSPPAPNFAFADPHRASTPDERYALVLHELKRDGVLTLPVPELARRAGWSVSYTWRLISEGRIAVTKCGRTTRVTVFEAARAIAYGA